VPLHQIRQNGANEDIVLNMHPQVSYFQSSLLEIAPEVIKQFAKLAPCGSSLEQKEANKEQLHFMSKY
jgi:hypothetical protein